jgi:DNA-binding SARP family transcriptional activator
MAITHTGDAIVATRDPSDGAVIRILGPVQIRTRPIRGKLAAVLTTLVLHANRPVSLDLLVAAVWDASPPRSAVANLRTYVRTLRTLLTDTRAVLDGRWDAYTLHVDPDQCDYLDFGDQLAHGCAAAACGSHLAATEALETALDLWRGDRAAPGVARLGPMSGWLDALDDERMRAVERLAAARIEVGEARLAARELTVLLATSPLRGNAWRLKMHAHHRLGEHEAVGATFRAASLVFRSELGLDPDPELVQLYRSMLCWEPAHADRTGGDVLASPVRPPFG